MIKRTLAMAALMMLVAGSAQAAPILFKTDLAPEVAGSSGHGRAEVLFDPDDHTLSVFFQFADLTGTTTVAHIHCCVDPPGTVNVATYPGTFPGFASGLTSGSYTSPSPIDLTLTTSYTAGFLTNFGGGSAAGAEAALLQGLLDGRAYLNVHTNFAPGGEIRGFLQVPEPATLLLLGIGAAAAATRRRRA